MSHINFSVPLHLDRPGTDRLKYVWTTVRHVRQALVSYLQHQALGKASSLRTAADSAICAVHPGQSVTVPAISVAQLRAELRQLAAERGWSSVLPVNTLELLVQAVLEEMRSIPQHRPVPFGALPKVWPVDAPAIIPVRGGVYLLSQLQVAIGLIGDHDVQFCDLFAVPDRFVAAVMQAVWERCSAEKIRLARAEDRLSQGETAALVDILRIGGRLQPSELFSGHAALPASGDLPVLTDRFRLHQQLDLNGKLTWQLGLRFRIDRVLFKPAWIDDTVGVDIGADELATYASFSCSGRVVVPAVRGTLPMVPRPHTSEAPRVYSNSMALATGRLALMKCVRPGYERAAGAILEHRYVAVEETNWSGFKRHRDGFFFPDFATAAHLPAFLHWLVQLAPFHGSQVSLTEPIDSSSRCSVCDRPGHRPRRGEPFRCEFLDCGAITANHHNASRNHRRLGLLKRCR